MEVSPHIYSYLENKNATLLHFQSVAIIFAATEQTKIEQLRSIMDSVSEAISEGIVFKRAIAPHAQE